MSASGHPPSGGFRRPRRSEYVIETSRRQIGSASTSIEDAQAMLAFIPAQEREVWFRMAMAMQSKFGDEGLAPWLAWSATAENYNERDALAVWRPIRPDSGITFGSLVHLACSHGWSSPAPCRHREQSGSSPTPTDLGLPEFWHHKATEAIRIRDWFAISMMVGSHERPPLLEALWPFLTAAEKLELLSSCISCGDFPSRVAWFLTSALDELHEAGSLVFDGDTARALYAELPDEIDVYRGTVQAEVDDGLSGICWTLNPELATWFATTHGRFRNTQSPPVVVSANVHKAEIIGLLTDRSADEVLLNPLCSYDFDVRAEA